MASLENVTAELKRLNENQLKAGELIEYVNAAGEVKEATFVKLLESTDRVGRRMLQLQAEQAMFAIGNDQVVEKESNDVEGILERIDDTLNKLIAFMGFQEKERERSTSATDFVGPPKPPEEQPGFMKGNFMKGFKDAEKNGLGLFEGPKKLIADILQTAGVIAATLAKAFAIFKTGLLFLGKGLLSMFSVITLPIAAIAALVVAITSGIFNFVEDFKSQEGSFMDKLIAGFFGFIDGFLKIITIPLDWLKDIVASGLELLGFDGAAQVLKDFSLTEFVDELTDNATRFFIDLKDNIILKARELFGGLMSFFGIDLETSDEEKERLLAEQKELEETQTDDPRQERTRKARLASIEKELEALDEEAAYEEKRAERMEVYQADKEFAAKAEREAKEEAERLEAEEAAKGPTKVATRRDRKRGRTIGPESEAVVAVDPETGKRGMVIGGPEKVQEGTVDGTAVLAGANYSEEEREMVRQITKPTGVVPGDGGPRSRTAQQPTTRRESRGSVVTALGRDQRVRNTARQVMVEQGLPPEVATTITNEGADIITNSTQEGGIFGSIGQSISNFFGGGEAVEQGGLLQLNQDRLASAQAAASSASQMNVPIINAPNNNQTSITNNTHVAAGMPATQDNSTRSHYRGRRI